MNERDLELVQAISSVIDDDGLSSLYLLQTRYTNLVRLNLVVLKALLEMKGRKGIMITVDRPHQYLSHLMQLHGVDQSNLTFLDAISTHAADTKGGAVAPEFQMGPFHIEALPDVLAEPSGQGALGLVDLSRVEFVVIDNISTLLTYNSMESVKEFLRKYMEVVVDRKSTPVQTVVVMDKDQHPDLYALISAVSRKAIDVGPEMQVKKVGIASGPSQDPTGSPDRSVSETKDVS